MNDPITILAVFVIVFPTVLVISSIAFVIIDVMIEQGNYP